jgi:hypothetical protein
MQGFLGQLVNSASTSNGIKCIVTFSNDKSGTDFPVKGYYSTYPEAEHHSSSQDIPVNLKRP